MKNIKLMKLKLINFKGIRSLELDAQGDNLCVYGRNKTGKTTIFDGFLWLLFDKDSQGKSQFDIKTKEEGESEPIHGLEHVVEGDFMVNDSPLSLKKVFRELWTKNRGSAQKKFSGHTTDYFISGVPVKKSEYDQKITEIVNEDIFRLLTDPRYYNEQLHWSKRREILIEICGDVSIEEVLAANKKLEKLSDLLDKHELEDLLKIVNGRKKEINEKLERLPIRIDEVTKNLPDVSGLDWKDLQIDIETMEEAKKESEEKLFRLLNGGEVAECKKQLAELEAKMQELKGSYQEKFNESLTTINNEINGLEDLLREVGGEIKSREMKLNLKLEKLNSLKEEITCLREGWHKINKKVFDEKEKTVCPTCGQNLPEGEIEKTREKFNLNKAKELEKINKQGREKNDKVEAINLSMVALKEEIEDLKLKRYKLLKNKDKKELQLSKLKKKLSNYEDDFEYQKLMASRNKLQNKLDNFKVHKKDEIEEVEAEIKDFTKDIDVLKDRLQEIKSYNQGQKRIEVLKAREKELASEYEKLEEQLFLSEEFIKTKVGMLEDKINSQFKYTSFKMFDEQINGGLKETCEALDAGVSYNNTLNTGSKYKVGIDIINTLSRYYGIKAPIFIDGRESITEPLDTESQLISLIVSPDDKTLRVEKAKRRMKDAS